jgi:hypothetical protein
MIIGENPYADFEGREETGATEKWEVQELPLIEATTIEIKDQKTIEEYNKAEFCQSCPNKSDCLNKESGRMCEAYYMHVATEKARAEGKGAWGQWRARCREKKRMVEIDRKVNVSDTANHLDRMADTYTDLERHIAKLRLKEAESPWVDNSGLIEMYSKQASDLLFMIRQTVKSLAVE